MCADPSSQAAVQELPPAAKLDKCAVLFEGLFRGIEKHAGTLDQQVQLHQEFEEGRIMATYRGPQLAVMDLRVLQGLVALASSSTAPRRDAGAPLEVRCTFEMLTLAIGYGSASGPLNTRLADSVKRLSEGTLTWNSARAGGESGEALLNIAEAARPPSSMADSRRRKVNLGIAVHLHSRLAQAVRAGRRGTQHYWLDMREVRALKTDAARLLHHRLCHINPGTSVPHGRDTLEAYVAGVPLAELSRHQRRHLQFRVDAALQELVALGWMVVPAGTTEWGTEKLMIRRGPAPLLGGRSMSLVRRKI